VAEAVSAQERDAIVFNKPFLFVIRDDATGAILFSGRVTDPAT
jgi:serine protease inhibitor